MCRPVRVIRTSLLLFLLCFAPSAFGQPPNQDCATAIALCAEQPVVGNNTGASGLLPGFCGTSALLWYTFTTNSVGGEVTVELTGIDCPVVAGVDNELSLVVLSNTNGCAPASFVVESGNPCLTRDSLPFGVTIPDLDAATTYYVVVAGVADPGTSTAQCDFILQVSGPGANVVDVDFDAGPNVTIGQGESTQLEATGGVGYSWSPTSGLSGSSIPDPVASPSATTIYEVTTTVDGCVFTDQVVVEVLRLIQPPNTFTPNGDGKNDLWQIPGIADYPGAVVNIHDRWGQRVYASNGYREPWDGTNGGRTLPDGTYYYHIQLSQAGSGSTPYTGFVSIIR
ncbi:MAG: gliding motility-associated C-terminal domain-containing protein [Flavobacteriales bacterium]